MIIFFSDDDSRVRLDEIPGVEESDYINASWINVMDQRRIILHFPLFKCAGLQASKCLHCISRYKIQTVICMSYEIISYPIGPKETTVDDFWRMVWQYKISHIVMLTGVCEGGRVSD